VDKLLLLSRDPYGVDSNAWRVVAEVPASMEVVARDFWFRDDLESGSLLLSPEDAADDPALTDALIAHELGNDSTNENDLAICRFATDMDEQDCLVAEVPA
jgi:hypothetical protein